MNDPPSVSTLRLLHTIPFSCGAGANDMLASLGFGNPVMGFWVGKGFVAGQGWGYNVFLDQNGRLMRSK